MKIELRKLEFITSIIIVMLKHGILFYFSVIPFYTFYVLLHSHNFYTLLRKGRVLMHLL